MVETDLFDDDIWSDEDEKTVEELSDLRAESLRLLTQQTGDRSMIDNVKARKQTP